jgi:hypothetical protein
MGLKPENKGIALVAIGGIGIVAAIMQEWATVTAIITGFFALLRID